MSSIPSLLELKIADSEVEVISWSAKSQELVLHLTKDACAESGKIIFHGVSLISLPPRFTVAGVFVESTTESSIPNVSKFEDEYVYVFDEPWGDKFYVIAESLKYEIAV